MPPSGKCRRCPAQHRAAATMPHAAGRLGSFASGLLLHGWWGAAPVAGAAWLPSTAFDEGTSRKA